MKSLISTVVAVAVVVSLFAMPDATRAQTSGEGQPAPGAPAGPAPAASPAPEPSTLPAPDPAAPPDTSAQPAPDPAAQPPEPSTAVAPTPAASEDPSPEEPAADEVVVHEERDDDPPGRWDDGHRGLPSFWAGFGRNVVYVLNRKDGDLRVRGRVRLVHVKGDRAEPVNAAFAYSSCTDCQSFAVALEIALVSPHASVIAPQNRARAVNYQCTRCVTFARALQYVYAVEDPDQVPDNVNRLIREMERELRDIRRDRGITPGQANARVSAVIAQFVELNTVLRDELAQTEDVTSPDATPAPDPAAAPAAPEPVPAPSPSAP